MGDTNALVASTVHQSWQQHRSMYGLSAWLHTKLSSIVCPDTTNLMMGRCRPDWIYAVDTA